MSTVSSEMGHLQHIAFGALAVKAESGIFCEVPVMPACSVLGDPVISDITH